MSNLQCSPSEVDIYDSIYFTVDHDILKLIYGIYGPNVTVTVKNGPKQVGTKECGLYAIATAVLLADGGDTANITFDQSSMRRHLLESFQSYNLTSFPIIAS